MEAYYDKIILGAGIYGLYAADYCGKKGQKVLVLEHDEQALSRASYGNQARVHMGYHYPRSFTTAKKSADYYQRFSKEFAFAIHDSFEKIYAISRSFSWTNTKQFQKFCSDADIPCEPINTTDFFKSENIEGAFLSQESSFDALLLKQHWLSEISAIGKARIQYGARLSSIDKVGANYRITLQDGSSYITPFLLNATYASVNQVLHLTEFEKLDIKYELCEIILCKPSDKLQNIGITVMDGPFFSLMPFGKSGLHSLTSVAHTPHKSSSSVLPEFDCQAKSQGSCTPQQLGNCNNCVAKPESAWPYMSALAKKYLQDGLELEYVSSVFAIKTVLKNAEVDDARPTIIRAHSAHPYFFSVLSGKINTIYDLNEILSYDTEK